MHASASEQCILSYETYISVTAYTYAGFTHVLSMLRSTHGAVVGKAGKRHQQCCVKIMLMPLNSVCHRSLVDLSDIVQHIAVAVSLHVGQDACCVTTLGADHIAKLDDVAAQD